MKGPELTEIVKAHSDHKITVPHLENHTHTKMHFSTMVGSFFLRISCRTSEVGSYCGNADIGNQLPSYKSRFSRGHGVSIVDQFLPQQQLRKNLFLRFLRFFHDFSNSIFSIFSFSAGKSLNISQQYFQSSYPIVASRNSTVVR